MGSVHLPVYTEVAPPGTDADAWFSALDGRFVAVSGERRVVRVLGIHAQGANLWIQLTCFRQPDRSLVVQVDATHTTADVLAALRSRTPSDSPFEILRVPHTT